jgi:hypothetical protein
MSKPWLDGVSHGVALTTDHMPVVSVVEQLLELRLRLRLGASADLDLAALPIGEVADIDGREPALPGLSQCRPPSPGLRRVATGVCLSLARQQRHVGVDRRCWYEPNASFCHSLQRLSHESGVSRGCLDWLKGWILLWGSTF